MIRMLFISRQALLGALLGLSFFISGCADDSNSTANEVQDAATGTPDVVEQVAAPKEEYTDVWGPPVGSRIPRIEATDHMGAAATLKSLRGENGLLLVFSRSADW